ncbi:Uncharacterised protein [Klebsiella pneumoniae]|nr:Uncharacterised protein [Klebsiella pneumoniae]
MGIDISKVDFQPLPKEDSLVLNTIKGGDEYDEYEEDSNRVRPINLKEAKAGLALYFGVNEDDIQITIKG